MDRGNSNVTLAIPNASERLDTSSRAWSLLLSIMSDETELDWRQLTIRIGGEIFSTAPVRLEGVVVEYRAWISLIFRVRRNY